MKRVLLVILDGWGLSPLKEGNATYLAKTPNLDWIYNNYPKTSLSASGIDVGITPGESGNSEVGHLSLGSGRVVWESLPRIDQAIENKKLFQNKNLISLVQRVKSNDGSLHLIGLCSQGKVHSSLDHLFALLQFAAEQDVERVYIHMITDGRDTAPRVAKETIELINAKTKELGVGKIATIIGRFYAMDRDKHYERTAKAYNLLISGQGDRYGSPEEAIEASYLAGGDDEKIGPCLVDEGGVIRAGDGVLFFNFRADRMRQLLECFESQSFSEFARQRLENLVAVTMTGYLPGQKTPVLFLPLNMNNVVADVIETSGLTQNHIAETEKYAHVTYFFNGGQQQAHQHEEQTVVPSPRVENYALVPEMSALAVKDKVKEAILKGSDFILVNFANGDMIGHSGNLGAAVKAVEVVDSCLGEILSTASSKGMTAIITADHGNCELMINLETNEINKEHTASPVPLVILDLMGKPFVPASKDDAGHETLLQYSSDPPTGILADVAPTILQIMQIPKPAEMSGIDLSGLI